MFTTILVQPLFNLLAYIYAIVPGHSLGLAVIIFTLLVRAALWPLVNRQLHSQKAMQQLNPAIAEVRKKAAGDKQKESQMLMELYKEKGINPFASLVPVLIQLPIFLALFAVLRDVIKVGEVAKLAYGPLKGLDAIKVIIESNVAINTHFLGFIDLAKPSPYLAVLAGILQYFQTKQLLPKGPRDAQAQAMASMSIIFPGLTILIGLTLPSALAVYWVTTSAVAIFQQWMILRQDVTEMETEVIESTATEDAQMAAIPEPKAVKADKQAARAIAPAIEEPRRMKRK